MLDAGPDADGPHAPDRLELDPPADDVDHHQAAEVKALGRPPQCSTRSPWTAPGRIPAHSLHVRTGICCFNALAAREARYGCRPRRVRQGLEQAIDGGRTQGEELASVLRGDPQSVPFERAGTRVGSAAASSLP